MMSHGGSSYSLKANIYKWNNSTGKFDVTASKTDKYAMGYKKEKTLTEVGHDYGSKGPKFVEKEAGEERRFKMPWGAIKAVVLDVDGDGTDEIAFAGFRSNLFEHLQQTAKFDVEGDVGQYLWYADLSIHPYLALIRRDKSD